MFHLVLHLVLRYVKESCIQDSSPTILPLAITHWFKPWSIQFCILYEALYYDAKYPCYPYKWPGPI